jgi:hypothetical protein
MSHCSIGACAGKSGACNCTCRECFCHYAYDLWQRDIEVAALRKSLTDMAPIADAARAYHRAVSRLDDREGALATLGRAAVAWAGAQEGAT